jgi:undecaprenyl phosphate N,N'-diacetylbacillosamine 1-phosphate transferase
MTFHLFINLMLDKSNLLSMYHKLFKPTIDFFIAFFGLIILSPLFLIVTLLLFFSNKGYPFFIQYRPGRKGKVFKIYKFKTMTEAKDKNGKLLPDNDRLTVIGNFVRKSSLDEIPQLINVLKGDMSLIGPRPLLTRYLHLYSDFQNRRHEIKPGITGWAQVNGRNAISWEKKFQYDVWYVDNLSLSLDFKIFLKTIQKVLKRDGINSTNSATIEPFEGD